MTDNTSELDDRQLEMFPIRYAKNRDLGRIFPYYDERPDSILVQRLKTNEYIWSPKELWDFSVPEARDERESLMLQGTEKIQYRIVDKDHFYTFNVSLDEYEKIKSGQLFVYWSKIIDKKLNAADEVVSTSLRGWCLATDQQCRILQDNINYNDQFETLIHEGGSELWSVWSSIKWLQEDEWREFTTVMRTPVLPPPPPPKEYSLVKRSIRRMVHRKGG
jgi:hypothetical protein